MREGIHPKYQPAKIICACGNVIETRSTAGDFHVEICSGCHPFFTGKQKLLDTAGRIERFKTRYAATPAKAAESKKAPAPEPKRPEPKVETRAQKRAKANVTRPKPKPEPKVEPELKVEAEVEAAADAQAPTEPSDVGETPSA